MTNSHVSGQIHQLLRIPENFRAKTVSFAGVEFSAGSAGRDTAGVLTAMLENGKGIVNVFHGRTVGIGEYGGDDSAHVERKSGGEGEKRRCSEGIFRGEASVGDLL